MTVNSTTKFCKGCNRILPLERFSKDKKTKDKLCFYCKDCASKRGEKHRKTAAGVYQQLKGRLNYEHNHPNEKNNWRHPRENKKKLLCTQKEFVEWYENQLKTCVYCGLPEELLQKTQDPYNKGLVRLSVDCMKNEGDYSLDNMALCCRRCNHVKSDLFTFEEMKEIGKLVKTHWEKEFYLSSAPKAKEEEKQ